MDLFDNRSIGPMLIGREAEPFDSPDYLYELKLDGIRCLAYLSREESEFRNKRHKKMNLHVPELTSIHKQAGKKCILDGELVVMADGVPDFYEIQRRSLTVNRFKLELAAKKQPATFTAFDILYHDGQDLTGFPLCERKQILAKAFVENERLALARHVEGQGIAFYELAKKQDLEGIVAKRKGSAYKANSRSKDWIKIKYLKDDDFFVCGYVPKTEKGNVASLILGACRDGRLVSQGHVTLGLSRTEFEIIRSQKRTNSPFDQAESDAVYIEPKLVCTVKYMERTPSGGLRQPVFKGLRLDKDGLR